jgi:myo-inositol 2-dehydrogenase/D-chiro-inositol 1-dehydrogenase
MNLPSSALADPVRVGLIGAGRIGTAHAEALAHRVPGARLVAIADPRPGAAAAVAAPLGARAHTDPAELFSDQQVEAIVIAASSTAHTRLILAAIGAGKAVFCEKPMAQTLEDADRAIAAANSAGLPLQVGFNRRFARAFREAHDVIAAGGIGTPQLLRSLTRDPGLANPGAVPPWTVFTQTLIHDFDALNWLNPGAEAVEAYATADALVAPDFKGAGLLDTAVVVVKFDNGAIATAEANFSAVYGYDVRAEIFGSAGMVSAGDTALTGMTHHTAAGRAQRTVRGDVELFRDAYAAQFASFVEAVRTGQAPEVTGVDARRALAIALACIESYQARGPVPIKQSAASP